MTKRHLTKQQRRRIEENQHEKQIDALESTQQIGRIIANFGTSAEVAIAPHQAISCSIRQNLPPLVAGDNVVYEKTTTAGGVIVALLPRISLLSRTNPTGDTKIMAANITLVFVVVAPEPEINWLVLDRYLIGLEQCGLSAAIVLNKSDLGETSQIKDTLQIYQKIGYRVFEVSAYHPETLTTLHQALVDQTSIFIGQSGVGKSSLIQALLPNEQLRTGALSARTRLGAHTTTTTRLYTFAQGGDLIDSPGIRDFGLNSSLELSGLPQGFIEFQPFIGQCKFKSCHHLNEPECALLKAAEDGLIATQRLENYQTLFKELEGITKEYGKNHRD
jgi:ribosome biogenesis GTPase